MTSKRLIFQVAVGRPSKLYEHCIDSVASYCKKYNIEHVVLRQPKLRIGVDPFNTNRSKEAVARLGYLPIFEKENAFEYLDEYDQVGIIDSDIYIRDTAPNIFDEVTDEYDFGAVVERDMPITQQYINKIRGYSKMQYQTLNQCDWKWNDRGGEFYNMGMMILNKSFKEYLNGETPKEFIQRLEFKDFVDGKGAWKWSTDQTLLNYFVKKYKIKTKQLEYKWNSLYTAVTPEAQKESHFVHFFLKDHLPNQGENVDQLMRDIHES